MSDMQSVGSGISHFDYQSYQDVQVQQTTKTLDVPKQDTMDSLSSSRSVGSTYLEAYLSPANKVQLPEPTGNSTLTGSTLMDGLATIKTNIKDFGAQKSTELNQSMNNQGVYQDALNSEIDKLTDQQLNAIAYQPGMTREQIQEQVLYAVLHPDVEVPENVRTIANQVGTTALSNARQTLGQDWSPESQAWIQDAGIMLSMQELFNKAIDGTTDLTKDEINQLHFALEHPGAEKSLSPKLRAKFNQIMSKVNVQAQSNLGVPSNWQFPNDSHSMTSVSMMFDIEVQTKINKLVSSGKLSEKEGAQLGTLHYNPDANFSNAAQLKEKLSKIEESVLNDLQKQYGFPPGYRPETAGPNRDTMVNLYYQGIFDKMLENYTPPLTAEDKNLIRASQGTNPKPLSPELQAIADGIKGDAMAKIVDKFGLPDDWTPQVGDIQDRSQLAESKNLFSKLLKSFQEVLDHGNKVVHNLPHGPTQNLYMVFLSMYASVLADLVETLQQQQITIADISKTLSQMRLDEQINKIEKQKRAMEEMKDKQQKGGFMGFLSNAFNWCINIIVIVLCPPLAIVVIQDASERGVNMASLDILKETVTYANKKLGKPMGTFAIIAATIAAVAIAILLSSIPVVGWAAGAAILVSVAGIMLVDTCFGNAVLLSSALMAVGVPETAAHITAMVIGIIISIIIEIILTVIIEVCTLGIGTEVVVAMWVAEAGLLAARVGAAVVRFVVELTIKAIEITAKVSQTMAKIIKFALKMAQAFIELLLDTAKTIIEKGATVVRGAARVGRGVQSAVNHVGSTISRGAGRLADEVGETMIGALIKTSVKEAAKNAGTKISRTAFGRTMKELAETSVGQFTINFIRSEIKDLFTFNLFRDMDDMARSMETFPASCSKIFDVQYHTNKVDTLKELQGSLKDVSKTQKELDAARTAGDAVNVARLETTLADRMSNLQRITKLVDDFDEGLGSKVRAFNQMHESEKTMELARETRNSMKAMDKAYQDRDEAVFTEALDEAKRNGVTLQYHVDRQVEHALEKLDSLAPQMKDEIQQAEAFVNQCKKLQRETQLMNRQLDEMSASVKAGKFDDVTQLDMDDLRAQSKIVKDDVINVADTVGENFGALQDENLLASIDTARVVIGSGFSALQAAVQMEKNILAGEMAKIQADLDSFVTKSDFMIRVLKASMDKLMDYNSDIGEQIADVGKQIRQLYQSNSQTMSSLSMAA